MIVSEPREDVSSSWIDGYAKISPLVLLSFVQYSLNFVEKTNEFLSDGLKSIQKDSGSKCVPNLSEMFETPLRTNLTFPEIHRVKSAIDPAASPSLSLITTHCEITPYSSIDIIRWEPLFTKATTFEIGVLCTT